MIALDATLRQSFETIYDTDLVYVSDCWKLCGDAHCCSFSRYKARFRMIARTPFQELPLLPGEYEFLQEKGWLAQFGDYDHKVIEYPLADLTMKIESLVSRKPMCACEHATRPTVCRLYPILPEFNVDGSCVGAGPMGIYEEMEQIAGMPQACQLQALPFAQMQKFLTITSELGRHPLLLFYLEAYRLTKAHVRQRVADAFTPEGDVFRVFERLLIRQMLIDHDILKSSLDDLLARFRAHYGAFERRRDDILPQARIKPIIFCGLDGNPQREQAV